MELQLKQQPDTAVRTRRPCGRIRSIECKRYKPDDVRKGRAD